MGTGAFGSLPCCCILSIIIWFCPAEDVGGACGGSDWGWGAAVGGGLAPCGSAGTGCAGREPPCVLLIIWSAWCLPTVWMSCCENCSFVIFPSLRSLTRPCNSFPFVAGSKLAVGVGPGRPPGGMPAGIPCGGNAKGREIGMDEGDGFGFALGALVSICKESAMRAISRSSSPGGGNGKPLSDIAVRYEEKKAQATTWQALPSFLLPDRKKKKIWKVAPRHILYLTRPCL